MTNDRIIDRVRKLLALAQDPSAAPNEADTAGRMAASLMAKYNLDLAALTDAELLKEWDITEAGMPGVRPGKKNAATAPTWIRILAFGVKVYTRTRCFHRGAMVYYRGARQDVELAHWMLKALIELAYKQSKASQNPNAFRNGFAGAVQGRLKALAKERDQADQEAGANALVVVDKLQAKLDELYGEEGTARKARCQSSDEGRSAGVSVALPTARPMAHKGTFKALPAA